MENKDQRPTFGATKPEQQGDSKRSSIGSIWEKTAKDSQKKYMTLSIRMSKQRIQELLASENGEIVNLKFVAFSNQYKNEEETSPDFKVYEESGR